MCSLWYAGTTHYNNPVCSVHGLLFWYYEQGELEVEHDEIILSMQQAEELLLEDSHHLDRYLVYAHLSRTGCKVIYHQPHLIFTSTSILTFCL